MFARSLGPLLVITLVAAMPLASQSLAEHVPASRETVGRLLKITRVEEYYVESMRRAMDNYRAMLPDTPVFPDAVKELLAGQIAYSAIRETWIDLYREFYTEVEVLEIIHFHESPVGQRVITVTPQLTARIADIMMERAKELLPRLMAELRRQGGGTER